MARRMQGTWIDLGALISQAMALEPLSPAVSRLVGLLTAADPDMREVERMIRFDAAISLRVMGAANSAFFAGRGRTRTVGEALLRLGTGTALNLIMSSVAKKQMAGGAPAYRLREMDLWAHSVAAAVAVEVGAGRKWPGFATPAFTAALLHDIGKVLLAKHLGAEIVEILERAEHETGNQRASLESEILGVHHGEVGGLIAQRWNMPEDIVRAITLHHDESESEPLCVAVRAANRTAKMALMDRAGWPVQESPLEGLVNADALSSWHEETAKRLYQVAELYEISVPQLRNRQNGGIAP